MYFLPKYFESKKQNVAPKAVKKQQNGKPIQRPNKAPASKFCKTNKCSTLI